MTIEILKTKDKIYAVYPNDLGKLQKSDLTSLKVLGKDIDLFLKPIINEIQLNRPGTIKGTLNKLRALGEAFAEFEVKALPGSHAEWQRLVMDVHRFIMTRRDRKSSLQTRQSADWQGTRKLISILMDEGIAPISLYLPPLRETLSSIDISRYTARLIGQEASRIVEEKDGIDKLLMKISLARTDSEYLDEVRDTLASRRRLLLDALTDYWKVLKENIEFGRDLISLVNWPLLEKELRTNLRRRVDTHPANPILGRQGLANYLAIIRYEYSSCPPSDETLRAIQREFEYLPRSSCLAPVSDWIKNLDPPRNFIDADSRHARSLLWWWQGRISHFDVSMITALLIMLQPSWTPQAVLYSKICDRNGKRYLELSEGGAKFEVMKPRANAMKEEILNPLSQEIIETLIACHSHLRSALKESNSSLVDLLFIPYGKKGFTEPLFAAANSFLSGPKTENSKQIWIGLMYPELIENGLGQGTINFSKIRKTEGMLEWFRTKNLKAVSRKLGNSERVVLQHYIPKTLLDAWNTRMIRRFQNLWLSIAAANEDFLLDITDFNCLGDLHAFIRDMLQLHEQTGSPISESLHERFRFIDGAKSRQSPISEGHLHVAISEVSLSALYAYQVHVLELGLSERLLKRNDPVTGISPHSLLQLADLLQLRLPEDKNPRFKNAHETALRKAATQQLRGKGKIFIEGTAQ